MNFHSSYAVGAAPRSVAGRNISGSALSSVVASSGETPRTATYRGNITGSATIGWTVRIVRVGSGDTFTHFILPSTTVTVLIEGLDIAFGATITATDEFEIQVGDWWPLAGASDSAILNAAGTTQLKTGAGVLLGVDVTFPTTSVPGGNVSALIYDHATSATNLKVPIEFAAGIAPFPFSWRWTPGIKFALGIRVVVAVSAGSLNCKLVPTWC